MKRFVFTIVLATSINCLPNGWTQVSPETAESNAIYQKINAITNQYGRHSSARAGAIFQFLKNVNSPVSYKILQEMCANGSLPAHYLNAA